MILFLISCTERSNFYSEIRNLKARAFRNLKKAHGQTAFFFFVPLASPRPGAGKKVSENTCTAMAWISNFQCTCRLFKHNTFWNF